MTVVEAPTDDRHGALVVARDGWNIVERLAIASIRVGAVPKTGEMKELSGKVKYLFRPIEAILERSQTVFAELGIVTTATILERIAEAMPRGENGNMWRLINLHVRWRFEAPDGSYVESEMWGEGLDSGDKAANKAMTASRKYALIAALNLAEGGVDPDAESPPEQMREDRSNGQHRERRPSEPSQPELVSGELWSEILGYRMVLSDDGRDLLRTFAAERDFDLTAPMANPVGLGRRMAAYAKSLVPKYPREADPNADPPHPDGEEPQDGPQPSIEELRDQMAAVQRDGTTAPQDGPVAGLGSPDQLDDAVPPPAADGPVETWECDGPDRHAIKGPRGSKCPMQGCGGFLGPEEPF